MALSLTSERIVPAEGPKDASIALVGEAPGAEEERQGRPFVGASGALLNQMLSAAGIARSRCYVTNVVKVRPPNNDFSVFYEKRGRPSSELLRWREELKRELAEVKPNVIVALGAEALRALKEDENARIGDWRGSIIATPWGKVVPTYHPALVLRQYSWRPIVEFDLRRAREESQTPELRLPERTLMTKPTLSEVRKFLEYAAEQDMITFDVETIQRGEPPRTVMDCIGIATSPQTAMCIPVCYAGSGDPYWSVEEEAQVWRWLAELMANPRVRKVAHNGQYDMLVLRRHGVKVVNFWLDTMNLMNVVYPGFPKALDFVSSIFTRQPYYKDAIHTDRWWYNAMDAAVTYEVALKLIEEAKEFRVWDFYRNHVHPLIQIYVEVQERGVRVDTAKLAEARAQVEREIEELQRKLDEAVGHPLNVNSPAQVRKYLYDELKLPKRFSRQGTLTSGEAALRALRARYDVPAIDLILALRERKKLLSVYLNAPFDPDGRMRASYNVAGTETGRLSSSESIDGTGTNLQNVPHGIPRQVIVPDPGNVFVGADLSQAEARVVAWLAQDERMIEVFESGGDIHKRNASFIFGKPEAEVTPEERYLAKRVVHASNYGMGPRKFAQIAEISEKQAEELLERYFATFPRIREWHREVEQTIRRTRTLVNPFGRRRTFYDRIGPELFREAYAYIPQSTVADQLHRATLEIYARLPEGARIALQVHDSIVVECRAEQVELVKQIVKEALERPIVIKGRPLVIPAEVKVGSNWDEV